MKDLLNCDQVYERQERGVGWRNGREGRKMFHAKHWKPKNGCSTKHPDSTS